MNRIYKLIYSRTLHQLVVTSELNKAATKRSSTTNKMASALVQSGNIAQKYSHLALSLAVTTLISGFSFANANANTRTTTNSDRNTSVPYDQTKDAAFNSQLNYVSESKFSKDNPGIKVSSGNTQVHYQQNVPVVNIATPNDAGVSDNRFAKFSSDTGIVFNNNGKSVSLKSSLLADKIAKNPNLAKEAKVILTQVTGNDKSVIKGVMEILGQRADLMIINPNGIDLNGVRLINTREFTASTAEVAATNAQKLNVKRGTVNVNGDLSTDDVDMIRIIAKAIQVKATIAPTTTKANKKKASIVLSAGSQEFDIEKNTAKSTETKAEQPRVAISGGTLGSMYGDKVNFIVTDSGAGVEYDGMVLGDDYIEITADGAITVNRTYANTNTEIKSKSDKIRVKSYVQAKGSIKVNAKSDVTGDALSSIHSADSVEIVSQESNVSVSNVIAPKVKIAAKRTVSSDNQGKVLANTAEIFAGNKVEFSGQLFVNEELNVVTDALTGKGQNNNARALLTNFSSSGSHTATSISFGGQTIVAGNTKLVADKVIYDGHKDADSGSSAYDFTFNNISITYDLDGIDNGVNLVNGSFAANELDLDYQSADEFPTKSLVNIVNGRYTVYQTTTLDLTKGGRQLTLRTQEEFDQVAQILNVLNSRNTKVNLYSIEVDPNTEITIDQSIVYNLNTFANKGTIVTKNSLGVVATSSISNDGLLYVNGNLILNSERGISLNGKVFALNNTSLTAPTISQQGGLYVGDNLLVYTDKYDLAARQGGKIKIEKGEELNGVNWIFHKIRKDKYYVTFSNIDINTSGLYYSPTETIVTSSIEMHDYANSKVEDAKLQNPDSNLTLHINNGRLYAGGHILVDGNVKVESTAYDIPMLDILKANNPINTTLTPVTLINTNLWTGTEENFANLYDFIERLLNPTTILHAGLYSFKRQAVIDALNIPAGLNPILQTVFSSIFGADWKGLDINVLYQKWETFKANPNAHKFTVFAPKSEVFAGGKIYVGKDLYVGAKVQTAEKETFENRNYTTFTNSIAVQATTDLKNTIKVKGIQEISNYLLAAAKQVKKSKSGRYTLTHAIGYEINEYDYENIADLNLHAYGKNIGDNGVLALLVVEQLKDLSGGALASANLINQTFKNLLASTEEYNRIVFGLSLDPISNSYKFNYEGKDYSFATKEQVHAWLNENVDHITFKQDEKQNNLYIPNVVLSKHTANSITNFNEVAASVTGIQQIIATNAKDIKVNFGAISAKSVDLEATNDIKLQSRANTDVVTSETFNAKAGNNFSLYGNANLGNTNIQADNATFKATPYFSISGDLANQGIIKANLINVIAKNNIEIIGNKITAGDKATFTAKDIDFGARMGEASQYQVITHGNSWSGAYVRQIGRFVTGTEIKADNITVDATNNITLNSTSLIAKDNVTVNASNNLITTASQDQRYVEGYEYKIGSTAFANARFGSFEASAEKYTTIAYNIDGTRDVSSADYSWHKAEPTAPGVPQSNAGVGFAIEVTNYKQSNAVSKNNLLDADNVQVNVGSTADLSNTNFNSLNNGTNPAGEYKEATVNAGEIKVNNNKDETAVYIDNKGFSIALQTGITSSVSDLASHITSAARADDVDQEVSPLFAATMTGDVNGLLTRNLINQEVGLAAEWHHNKADIREQADSTVVYKGDLNLNTNKGNIQLHNVQGQELKEVNINSARDLTIHNGVSNTVKYAEQNKVAFSLGVSYGLKGLDPNYQASVTVAHTKTSGVEFSHTVKNSQVIGDHVSLNAEGDINLIASNIHAKYAAEVNASKNLTLKSVSDAHQSLRKQETISFTAGSLIHAPVPFTSLSLGGSTHGEEKVQINQQAAITAGDAVNVKTGGNLTMVSAFIGAEEGKITAQNLYYQNIQNYENIDGYGVSKGFGINLQGVPVINVNAFRDANREYKADILSTVAPEVELNLLEDSQPKWVVTAKEDKETKRAIIKYDLANNEFIIDSTIDGDIAPVGSQTALNRDIENVVAIKKNVNNQATPFSFSVSTAPLFSAESSGINVKDTFGQLQGSIKSNPRPKRATNNSHVTGGQQAILQQNNVVSTLAEVNGVTPEDDVNFAGTSFNNVNSLNDASTSNTISTGVKFASLSRTKRSTSFLHDLAPNQSIDNILETGIVIHKDGSSSTITAEQAEELKQLKKSNKYFNSTKVGVSSIDSSNLDSTIDNSYVLSSLNSLSADKLFASVEDANSNKNIYYRPVTDQISDVFKGRNIDFTLFDLNNHDRSVASVNLESIRQTISTTNLPANNPEVKMPSMTFDPSNFNIAIGDEITKQPYAQQPTLVYTDGENTYEIQIPVKDDGSMILPETHLPDVSTVVPSGSDTVIDTTLNPRTNPSPVNPIGTVIPSTSANIPIIITDRVEPKVPTQNPVVIPKTETPVIKFEEPRFVAPPVIRDFEPRPIKEITPADGNMKSGETTQVDTNHRVTKLVFDDLTCYLLEEDAKAAREKRRANIATPKYTENDFENFLMRNGGGKTATMFSTFSESIISVLGDNGVICVATGSPILKMDFSVAEQSQNALKDKNIAEQRIKDQLHGIAVINDRTTSIQMIANRGTSAAASSTTKRGSSVKLASFGGNLNRESTVVIEDNVPRGVSSTVIEISKTLRRAGIDTSKLLILGTKSSGNAQADKELPLSETCSANDPSCVPNTNY